MLNELEVRVAEDRLEGWEIVEFLQIPAEDILRAAIENDWITPDNLDDFLEYIGLKDV